MSAEFYKSLSLSVSVQNWSHNKLDISYQNPRRETWGKSSRNVVGIPARNTKVYKICKFCKATKLCNFTNFSMLFLAVVIYLYLLA
jgi:hypothetical protein